MKAEKAANSEIKNYGITKVGGIIIAGGRMDSNTAKPLVIGISSRALLDLERENTVYEQHLKDSRAAAIEAFIKYQDEHREDIIPPGVAFPLVKALLDLNNKLRKSTAKVTIEVVIISRNHPACGTRIINSLAKHGLLISKSAFTGGEPVLPELQMFGVDLFLSYDEKDVVDAGKANISAAKIFGGPTNASTYEGVPLLAFDGDSTIFSDESDQAYDAGLMPGFTEFEKSRSGIPLADGPLAAFFRALAEIHQSTPIDNPPIKIALVTSRNFHLMGRPIDTLKGWGIQLDKAYAIGTMSKRKVLEHLRPLMFFDDRAEHCADAALCTPTAHVIALNPAVTANSNGHVPAQVSLITAKGEPKNDFLLICRGYLNAKNGSSEIKMLEQWFDRRLAAREPTEVQSFMNELETSIKGTPVGNERPAKGAKNEKSEKLMSFINSLERKYFG